MAISSSACAYWEVIPQVDAGLTWEENPRYIANSQKSSAEEAQPGITDDATGTFIETGLSGGYLTPANEIRLSPRIRKTDFLKSNKDLNSDNWSINLSATHTDQRGLIGLSASYDDTSVRTNEFESATPEDVNAPPDTTGGSGRFIDDATQTSKSVRPFVTYNLSTRNSITLSLSASDVEYDQSFLTDLPELEQPLTGYVDYTYQQGALEFNHYLNDKNFFQVSLNSSNYSTQQPGDSLNNSSESFGISAAYNLAISPTLSANANVGLSHSSSEATGLRFDPLLEGTPTPCPANARCTASDDAQNFVGDIGLRMRGELTTLNFNVTRSLAPRSNGGEVVQDQARIFVDRTITERLSINAGTIYSEESALTNFNSEIGTVIASRQDRTYFTVDTTVTWRLTPTLSTYGKYSYQSNDESPVTGDLTQVNHRLFFGFLYRGVGFRR